jgi:hypothetical protein
MKSQTKRPACASRNKRALFIETEFNTEDDPVAKRLKESKETSKPGNSTAELNKAIEKLNRASEQWNSSSSLSSSSSSSSSSSTLLTFDERQQIEQVKTFGIINCFRVFIESNKKPST